MLGIAILAGLAAGVLNFVTVKEKITTTINDRDTYHKNWDTETAAHKKFEKLAKDTQSALERTNALLVATQAERDTAVQTAADQTKRAQDLADNLKKTQVERDSAQNDLAAWKALGIPIENIKTTLASLKAVTEERDAIEEEKKVLTATNYKLNQKIQSILNPDYDVPLPAGLKGKVLVADPRYDFVVLDIGEKQGVLEDGKLLVNRNGKLIAKVKVKSVQADRCIANVMPGWKLGDVMEGDQVLY
ncbi:MAG TPA: hypothetical protein VH413_14070 [Verrucomicrobiae bacterium]|jgi:hypothetical protein|nr:hypothetical protein [Verrucomicrobiae bacterium]